ncbi:MAG: PhoH family protein [Prevotellaceae bacterium]|nr:PhoH family protein [Candidatus Faecinaster equi]
MATKKKNIVNEYGEAPKNIDGHPFYGLVLDEDQIEFVNAILNPDKLIVFANCKAGTGKTLMAVAAANLLVQYGKYDGIVYVVSPVQEEKLGFLPGSPEEKISIYLTPLYDALAKLNINPYNAIIQAAPENQKNGAFIDCVSHVYLRGCNLENKVIICEETQNMYTDELKKVLTRVSDTSKTIVIGHSGQCDLYHHPENSGFVKYIEHFKDKEYAQKCELKTNHRGLVSSWADELNN